MARSASRSRRVRAVRERSTARTQPLWPECTREAADWPSAARLLLLATFLATTLFASGCLQPPVEPFRVGTSTWPGFETLYLARAHGRFNGEIRLVEMHFARDVASALVAGSLEAAALPLDEALSVSRAVRGLLVVMVTDTSAGGHCVLGGKSIKDLAALRGAEVAVARSGPALMLLHHVLSAAKLTPELINRVYMPELDGVRALKVADVDAVVTSEPQCTRLVTAGFHRLFDSRRLPHRMGNVLVVRPHVAENRGKPLRRLIAAHFAERAAIVALEPATLAIVARRQRAGEADIRAVLGGRAFPDAAENRRLLGRSATSMANGTAELVSVMNAHELISVGAQPDLTWSGAWLPRGRP